MRPTFVVAPSTFHSFTPTVNMIARVTPASTRLSGQYIPPIRPPCAGASFFSSGISATSASVVSRSEAIDAAF